MKYKSPFNIHKEALIALILVLICSLGFSQPHRTQEKYEEIQKKKVQYLTEKMSLTPEEGQVFWPLYNEFEAKKEAIRQEVREKTRKLRRGENSDMSNEEKLNLMQAALDLKEKNIQLEKLYFDKFKKELSVEKLYKFYKADKEFKRVLLHKFRETKSKNSHLREAPKN